MLKIKLQKIGKKHQPSYRVVVAEKRSKLDGPAVEDLGFYNSFTKELGVNKDKVQHWLSVGAQPTPSVHNLLVNKGVVDAQKIKIHIKKAEPKPEESPVAAAAAPAAPEIPAETASSEENKTEAAVVENPAGEPETEQKEEAEKPEAAN